MVHRRSEAFGMKGIQMRTCSVPLLLGVLALATAAPAEEFWLHYRLAGPMDSELGNVRGAGASLSPTTPKDVALPSLTAEKPWFGRAKSLGDRLVVLDKSKSDAPDWDALWFDANGDGKLDPSERFLLTETARSYGRAAVVPVVFPSPDGPQTQRFLLCAYVYQDRHASLQVQNAGYSVGRVKFGDKSRLIALVDGAYWDIGIALDGATISVAKSAVQTGRLDVDKAAVKLVVAGEAGSYRLSRSTAGQPFLLPVGKYKVTEAVIEERDKKGVTWTLRSSQDSGARGEFSVAADQAASIRLGAPLAIRADPRKQGKGYAFSLDVKGVDCIP
jgi:hypothetical protein